VLDPSRVQENYRRFSAAFPDAHVMYAAKAHTGQAVLSALLEADADIECAAAGRAPAKAIQAGADPDTLQYTAVNPPDRDLDYAVDLAAEHPGLTITAGARDTFDRLEARGYDGRVAIRINPGIGTGHHEKVATGKDAKFGIPYEEVPDVAADVRERFDLVGIHAHAGSGGSSTTTWTTTAVPSRKWRRWAVRSVRRATAWSSSTSVAASASPIVRTRNRWTWKSSARKSATPSGTWTPRSNWNPVGTSSPTPD